MRIGGWESAIRGLPGGSYLVEAITTILASVMGGYHIEHTVDDGHSVIHATGAIFERKRTTAIGDTIPVFFKPTDYTANGAMTWTVPNAGVVMLSYFLVGSRMFLDFYVPGTTIGGVVNTTLRIKIPDGYFAAQFTASNPCRIVDNGVPATGLAFVAAGAVGVGNILGIQREDSANWTASAGNASVQGQINFEVRTA